VDRGVRGDAEQTHQPVPNQAVDTYTQEAAGTTGPADEVAKLSDLKNTGEITTRNSSTPRRRSWRPDYRKLFAGQR
jgi:hypothetical protein